MSPEEELEILNQIIDEILRGIQDSIQNGEVLSDEFLSMVAQELNLTTDRITELNEIIQGTHPGAQLLWILAGQNPDAFINYLRTFPDPELNALLRNPSQLAATIQNLQRTMPQGELPSADGIPHAPLNSSNIYGFRYDQKSGRLLVRFQSGSVYGYQGVPPGVFKVFQEGAVPATTNGQNKFGKWWTGKIPSLGAAFYQLIRSGGYPYVRLS